MSVSSSARGSPSPAMSEPPRKSRIRHSISSSTLGTQHTSSGDISKFPTEIQEALVVEDLLYVLMGIEGRLINYRQDPFPLTELDAETKIELDQLGSTNFYRIDVGLGPSLMDFVKRILPLATFVSVIEAFCCSYSRFTSGFVNHAICAALRTIIKEYTLLVVQLEGEFRGNASFSLQKLWYHLHPSFTTLHSCAEICLIIHDMTKLHASAHPSRAPSMLDMSKIHLMAATPSAIHLSSASGLPGSGSSLDVGQDSVATAWYAKGGGLLGMLSNRYIAMSGDPNSKKLHRFLLSFASQPFLQVLRKWIHLGKLEDPYDEFLVVEKDLKKTGLMEDFNDKYWEQRYKIRPEAVPPFLAPYAEKILLTGKYLNVYIECGESVASDAEDTELRAQSSGVLNELATLVDGTGQYILEIEAAYRLANRHLLDYLMHQQLLLERLKSIKHFFLLDQSDFIDHFLDLAADELCKPWQQVSTAKLQSLLDIAIRNPASVACRDPFKEDLKVGMEDASLFDQLLGILGVNVDTTGSAADLLSHAAAQANATGSAISAGSKVYHGIHALVFWYKVDFPLSLVFSKRAIVKYQMLLRNLIQIRHLERQLSASWMLHAQVTLRQRLVPFDSRDAGAPGVELLHRLSTRLSHTRMRMLALVESLGYYVTHDVIEPHHLVLERRMQNAQTVDDVLNYLHDFLATCIKEAFMSNSKLLRIYHKLVELITRFVALFEIFARLAQVAHETHPSISERLVQLDRSLAKIETSWSYHARLLIDSLKLFSSTEVGQFIVLMNRLDFNGFYAVNNAGLWCLTLIADAYSTTKALSRTKLFFINIKHRLQRVPTPCITKYLHHFEGILPWHGENEEQSCAVD